MVLSPNRSFLFFEIALATDYHKKHTISFSAASEGLGAGDVTLGLTHFLSFRKDSKVLSAASKTSKVSGQVCFLKKGHSWEEMISMWGLKLGGIRWTDTQFHQEGFDK